MPRSKKLKVLFVSSEVEPFSKTGGLADVAGSLPVALHKAGVDIRIMTPRYRCVRTFGDEVRLADKVPVYFIKNDKYFMRDDLYGGKGGDYPDNLERFAFFSRTVLEQLKKLDFKPDIIHCNDWQTALVPAYLKEVFTRRDKFYENMKTVLTVHNLGYQGIFSKYEFPKTGLGWEYFTMHRFEFYDNVNILKGGLVFADLITTVSPTYSKEIQTAEFGCGLEGLLSERGTALYGILNGIDTKEWDPSGNEDIKYNFSAYKPQGKRKNKTLLQKECGLESRADMPLVAIISRLVDQKGLDLISRVINPLLDLDVQFILLGTGEEKYHRLFGNIGKNLPHKASINLKFDELLAKKIYAGADIFLMPSKYEPCGLGQMIALRYGTIPLVRRTGGLADTVLEFDGHTRRGNGFLFERYDAWELFDVIKKTIRIYRQKGLWTKLVSNAMESDFSWDRSAKKYIDVYRKLI